MTVVSGSPAPERQCGGCVACCKFPEIKDPELMKPANLLCRHCTGSGCSIYATRPNACRTWNCMWRKISKLPDEWRPDRIGVAFWIDKQDPPATVFDRIFVIGQAIDDPAAFNSPAVRAAIETFAQQIGWPIWLGFGGERRLVYPDAALQDAILRPATTAWKALVPAALAWRKNYGLDS